jgi:hypothetical protein
MTTFDVSTVPWHWRLGADRKWLRGPKAALDAATEILNSKETTMPSEMTTSEDIRKLAQRLRQNLNDDDLAALVNLLMSDDTSSDQPPLQPELLAPEKAEHALDHLPPRQRYAARERVAAAEAKRLSEASKRWPQAARLAIACVVFGRWRPVGALVAAIGFGMAEAAQIRLQTHCLALSDKQL